MEVTLPSMATIRTVLVFASVISTVIILAMMISEQEKVKSCTEKSNKFVTPVMPPEPKVIVVHAPAANHSQPDGGPAWDHNWDKKAWADPRDAKGVPTRTLILVRHGQYDLQTGKLTDLGKLQANMTGRRLSQMNMNFKEIIHSTLDRAVETAEKIHLNLPGLQMIADDYIREGGPVPPVPTITYWGLPDRDYYVDGPRLEAAFRKHFYRADKSQEETSRQILVGHGNIFRFFLLRALQLPKEAWMRFFIAHASITVIHIHADGSVAADKIGDSGHLPTNMVTY